MEIKTIVTALIQLVIIGIPSVIIGYFLKKLLSSVDLLSKVVAELKLMVNLIEANHANFKKNVDERCASHQMSISKHEELIDKHTTAIEVIKEKLKHGD